MNKKMKIGIVTFQRAHNYGAVLQGYSLKTFLEKLNPGCEVEIIDYWPQYHKAIYDLFNTSFLNDKISIFQKLKRLIKLLLVFPTKLKRVKKFESFIRNNLNLSNNTLITNGSDIQNLYNIIIFGSDQIWRYSDFNNFKGYDPVYWGKYPKSKGIKKIAYAASMGVMEISPIQQTFIKNSISRFDFISVREKELVKIIQQNTNQKVEHVLDPVFLTESNDWLKLANMNEINEKKYVLFYNLNFSQDSIDLANYISKKYNYKIIELNGWVTPFSNPLRQKQSAGPIDFISLFANASFVISTSFHGVAFSLIFEKQFYSLGMANNSKRVTSLLEDLNLGDRYLKKMEIIDIKKRIDYSLVNKKLEELKNRSIKLLKSNI